MKAAWRIKALALAGRIILENGGETYRAEDTVAHMAQSMGLSEVDVFGVPSGLFISCTDEDGERQTTVTRVYPRGTHLSRVDAVNQLSRKLAAGELAQESLLYQLEQAQRLGEDASQWLAPTFAALSAFGFAVMFGGGLVDMAVGGLCAALTQLVPRLLSGRRAGASASALIGSLFCTLLSLLFHALTGLGSTDVMVASALMPLVPGLSMTNAVQDILRGDMVSGVAHGARAVMVAALLAGGALIGTHLFQLVSPYLPLREAAAVLPANAAGYVPQAIRALLSSFVAGGGFGALLCAPKKGILWGAVIGALGYFCYFTIMYTGASEAVAMFAGALVAAAAAQLAAKHLRMIATVFVTIAILPLVPGIGLYRAMSALAQGQISAGLSVAAQTMALFVMIALGVGLGSSLVRIRRRAVR